jgi:hypothetical protein
MSLEIGAAAPKCSKRDVSGWAAAVQKWVIFPRARPRCRRGRSIPRNERLSLRDPRLTVEGHFCHEQSQHEHAESKRRSTARSGTSFHSQMFSERSRKALASSKVRIYAPVATSHSLIVLSQLPDSTRVPSAENATEVTPNGDDACPSKVRIWS